MRFMRAFCTFFILSIMASIQAQTLIKEEADTTVLSEYYDGQLWAYRQIGDFVVGMTNNEEKDYYGKYYQISISIKNLGTSAVVFSPEDITSTLYNKQGEMSEMR